jgi:hypothetical protein
MFMQVIMLWGSLGSKSWQGIPTMFRYGHVVVKTFDRCQRTENISSIQEIQ